MFISDIKKLDPVLFDDFIYFCIFDYGVDQDEVECMSDIDQLHLYAKYLSSLFCVEIDISTYD